MIASVSSSSAAPLRPISVMPMGCQCMACAPQLVMKAPAQPVAPAAPSIESKSNVSSLNLVVAQAGASEGTANEDGNASTAAQPKAEEKPAEEAQPKSTNGREELTDEEKAQLAKLRARDREVRAHEQAHAAAGAGVAGAPSYSYQQGPDGKQYAVGGEVSVKTSASSSNPRQAIAQLQQVARAALAPASPSGQDRAVAAQARAQAAQLQAQLAQESQAKAQEALKGTAEKTQAAVSQGSPAESKPLLPELPRVALSKATGIGGNGESGEAPRRGPGAGAVQPIPASVIAPAKSAHDNGGFEVQQAGGSGVGSSIAAYQQQLGQFGGNQSGTNGVKPISPALNGRIISLNA